MVCVCLRRSPVPAVVPETSLPVSYSHLHMSLQLLARTHNEKTGREDL